ncbi:MAG: type II toxin-antitoxin system VapC family toxin [Actinomycetota bacterium]
MAVLIDTHVLLWWITDDRRLSKKARDALLSDEVLVSVVSAWEIEIKRGLGRIAADTHAILSEVSRTDGFRWLDIRPSHVAALIDLPPLHRDPFDRMLIAQADHERVAFVTRDKELRRYPIDVIW